MILKEYLLQDAKILPGSFVLALKTTGDVNVKFKERYSIEGHGDKVKHLIVHYQSSFISMILAIAAILDFQVRCLI